MNEFQRDQYYEGKVPTYPIPYNYEKPTDDGGFWIHSYFIDGNWYGFGWDSQGNFACMRKSAILEGGFQEYQPWDLISEDINE